MFTGFPRLLRRKSLRLRQRKPRRRFLRCGLPAAFAALWRRRYT